MHSLDTARIEGLAEALRLSTVWAIDIGARARYALVMRNGGWKVVASALLVSTACLAEPQETTTSSTQSLTLERLKLTMGSGKPEEALGNVSLKDTSVTYTTSEASEILGWLQSAWRRRVVETPPLLVVPDVSAPITYTALEVLGVELRTPKGGADEVIVKVRAKEGMIAITAPKLAWDRSWPPPKK
jgi:hypothetical protein